ncbi:MAG TPA: branched-chain amino acid ABC transporter permease [Ilumatobacteraceae bacterium]|jgi:branched-chain amino acid transport system permease protein
MEVFLTAIFAGIAVGAIYIVLGVGATVVYNATRVFNLAQGDFLLVGVMASYVALDVWKWGQIPSLIVVLLAVTATGLIEERSVVRYFLAKQGSGGFGWFISTLGFSLVLETVIAVAFGNRAIVTIPSPFPAGGVHLGNVVLGYQQLFVVGLCAALVVAVSLFYERTWLGRAMRGAAEDREAASLLGINPIAVSRVAFAISGVVCGLAAFAIAPLVFSDPTVGPSFTLKAFLALAIGGFGSIKGAVIGGLLIGIAEQLWSLYWAPNFDLFAGLLLLLIVLVVRPSGIFKSTAVRTV